MGILALGERQRVRLFVRRDALDRFVDVPRLHPARPLQHREPRAHRDGSSSRRSAAATSTGRCSCPSRCSCASTTSSTRRTACRTLRRRRDRAAAGRGDARVDRRPARGAHRRARRGARQRRSTGATSARSRPPTATTGAPAQAVADIDRIEELDGRRDGPIISLYRPPRRRSGARALQAVQRRRRVAVRRAADVRAHGREGRRRAPVRDHAARPRPVWIYDFGLRCVADDVDRDARPVPGRVPRVWRGELENDGLNGLVLRAGLTGAR